MDAVGRSVHALLYGICMSSKNMQQRCKVQARRPARLQKFRSGRAFCGARTNGAVLILGTGEAITLYYVLAAGLCAVLRAKIRAGLDAGPARFGAAPV